MKTFKDSTGKKRTIVITFRTLFQCADDTGYDLLNPASPIENTNRVLSDELMYNPGALARVLYSFCKEDGETQEAFFDALDGKAFKDGEDAFWEEYRDFFAQSGRDLLATTLERDLTTKTLKEQTAKNRILNLPLPTFSDLSQAVDEIIGSTQVIGSSQDSQTQTNESERKN